MEKEYVCVESDNKEMIGFVFLYEETMMNEIWSQGWETKTYHRVDGNAIYAEKKDISYMVMNDQEYVILDAHGCLYYKGGFQHLCRSPKWIQEKDYLVCVEYHQDFESGDIVKLKSDKETRLEVIEKVICKKTLRNSWRMFSDREHYEYKLKGKDERYTVNELQLAFKKDKFTFKRCIKAPRGKLVLNRIYRCCDYSGCYYDYRAVYYESGFRKTLGYDELECDYKFVDATLEEYLEQYNAQFEPKQKRVRTYSHSKRKEDGKVCRDNFADFINGKACVHINSESDMNWFRLALQQYGLEHKLSFKYDELIFKVNYLVYENDIVKYGIRPILNKKVLEVTDLL